MASTVWRNVIDPTWTTVQTCVGAARVRLQRPRRARLLVVLGHGAGGGVDTPDLLAVTAALVAAGAAVARVEQPYRVAGRRAPAPARQLDAAWRDVVAALREDAALSGVRLVSGGRSSGARVACRTAADVGAAAVLALAFPLHPPGRDTSRLPELLATDVPVLVVQGARDPFGAPEEFTAAVSLPRSVTVRAVAGDHALRRAPEQVAAATVAWLRGLGLLPAAAGTDHDGQPGTPT